MPERSPVLLVDTASGAVIEAELLAGLSLQQIEDTETVWRIALRVLREKREAQGEDTTGFLEHDHWDWTAKLRAFAKVGRFYGIERDALMQGLMLLRFDKVGRLPSQKGLPLVYVDYIESAPWNLFALGKPRFRSVGAAFLRIAVEESQALGREGRVGLHSLPQAEGFYRHLGMEDMGQDPDYANLVYFEMTPGQAIELLRRKR